MKRSSRLPLFRSHVCAVAAAFGAAFGFGVLAAPTAQAFTLDYQGGTNSDGSAKYVDPDKSISPTSPASRFGSGGQTSIQQGNATVYFGPARQPFNQRYNADNLFDPLGRPAGER